MEVQLPLRLVLLEPPPDVDFGIQKGRGAEFSTMLVQSARRGNLHFDFTIGVNDKRPDALPNFTGPIVQGPPGGRFIYIDVGTCAGQKTSPWSRRMKVPLKDITWDLVRAAGAKPGGRLVARIPGTGRDGSPSCATVKFSGTWEVLETSGT